MATTTEFVVRSEFEEDREVWSTPSRQDIEMYTKAFEQAKTKLHFNAQYVIEETLSMVGPQEHLDHEILTRLDTMKATSQNAVSSGDELPPKVIEIIEGVIDKANKGQTSTFLAAQNLETTLPAYNYGRESVCDKFQLSFAGRNKLKEFDEKFIEVIQYRLNSEIEMADKAMEQCHTILNEADKESQNDKRNLYQRQDKERSTVTMESLQEIEQTAHEELTDDQKENETLHHYCKDDINSLDESLKELETFADSARQEYNNRTTKRNNILLKNRKRQEELRNELQKLEEEERELLALLKDENDIQKIADTSYNDAQTEMTQWKEQITSLGHQTDAALSIINDMTSCTELILKDAIDHKTTWTQSLNDMETQMLLQCRDTLLAKIRLHKMIKDDCGNNLEIIKKDLVQCESDKKKWSQTGFKHKVENVIDEIKSLNELMSEIQEKIERNHNSASEAEDELAVIDKSISDIDPHIKLPSSQSTYDSFRHTLKKVFEKEDIGRANFCSNYKYN